MTGPHTIFFDWDGTLVDSLPMMFRSHNHVRETFSLPLWTMDEYKQHMYLASLDLYPQLYGDKSDEALKLLYAYFEENHIRALDQLDGSLNSLKGLQDFGINMGLVSNKKHEYLEREVDHLGWRKFFKAVSGAGNATKNKPNPEPLLEALEEAGVQPCKQSVWYVGDTRTDIETANGAGCASVLLLYGEDKQDIIDRCKPDYIFEDMQALHIAAVQKNEKKAC